MSETRKIAAILVSDVVGYSRLAGADEDRTLARLRTLRSDLIDPTIAVHHGRVVKRTGDGIDLEFRSVVDAVRCAIEVQNAMIERNAGVPPEKRIEFRIGVHLGDVVEESDGDLMGDGVNIAARLEGIAKPGAICLSEEAYWQVKGRLDSRSTISARPNSRTSPSRSASIRSRSAGRAEAKPSPTRGTRVKQERSTECPATAYTQLDFALGGARRRPPTWCGCRLVYPRRPPRQSRRRPRISRSSCCHSRTSPAIRPGLFRRRDDRESHHRPLSPQRLLCNRAQHRLYLQGKNADAREIGKELGVRYVMEGQCSAIRARCASMRS